MKTADKFNQSAFSHWINSRSGRMFRLTAGICFLAVGVLFRDNPLGIAAIVWSFFPLTAGAFDVCYISAVLGGPFSGSKIRAQQSVQRD
jgi:hypothetical protein